MYSGWPEKMPRTTMEGVDCMGKHDPTRDGDVHSDTAKQLDPKEFEKSSQISTDDDNDENDD